MKSKKPAFKVLLVLDNAPGHMQDLGLNHLTTQVGNLSSTVTSILQLLGQGIVTAFKRTFSTLSALFWIILDADENGIFVSISGC
jgi:hypothetical protein